MVSTIKKVAAASLLATSLVSTVALPGQVYAWETKQSASSNCEAYKAVINWSFTNTERDPKWSMDVVVTDKQTGKKSQKVTIPTGQTATGKINTEKDKIDNGSVEFFLTWTNGNPNTDKRSATYKATETCVPEKVEQPKFDAVVVCNVVDGKAKYSLKITEQEGTKATFSPENGAVLENGEAVDVTATYTDEYQKEQTVTVTAEGADNCTPPTVEEPEQPQVKADVKQLPNTGAGAGVILGAITAVSGAIVAGYNKIVGRKNSDN